MKRKQMVLENLPHKIEVDIGTQTLNYLKGGKLNSSYLISTGEKGVGELIDSEQTPRGWHRIRAKIGDQQPRNAIFVGRRPTGEIYTPDLGLQFPERDWILTRIMWLCGLEPGFNRFGECDTMKRYIYIHGSPDSKEMGIPSSKGCINMHNNDLLELFSKVPVGTKVYIKG